MWYPFDSFFQSKPKEKCKKGGCPYNYIAAWNAFRGLTHEEQALAIEKIMAKRERSSIESAIMRRWEKRNVANVI
jgi:hypothetical protein